MVVQLRSREDSSGQGAQFGKPYHKKCMSALPSESDINLLGNCEGVIDFYPQISDSALYHCVPEKQLNGSEIASAPID